MRHRRGFILALWIVFDTMVAVVAGLAFLVWEIRVPHSPDLPPTKAAALISGRPEFNRYATLLAVSSTTRGADSLKHCCYSAVFTFVQNGSPIPIAADAEFHHWEGAWHLAEFSYGKPPDVTVVWVKSDAPLNSK